MKLDAAPKSRPKPLPALVVAAGVVVLMGFTIRDYGLTTDEPTYIRNNHHVIDWFHDFANVGFSENLSEERLKEGWQYTRQESKNLPLVTVVSTLGYVTLGRFDSFPAAYRWGNVFVFAATCAVMFHWVRTRYSSSTACVALIALLGTPRLFAHANLVAMDTLVGCFWVLASWALVNSRRGWKWAIAFGIFAGIGATSKLTFWFAVPIWILWGLFHRPRELWRPAVCLCSVAPLVAYLLLPMWWTNPVGGFFDYLELLSTDTAGWKIGTYYLGEIYQTGETGPVPWHAVIVLTAVTTPLWILILAGIGSCHAVKLFGDISDDSTLWLMCAVTLPVVCMLPNTPNHDGLRLYRAAFFFAPMLAGAGLESLRRRFFTHSTIRKSKDSQPAHSGRRFSWAVVAVLAGFSIWQTARIHPGQLSFYNVVVGGLPAAAAPRSMLPTLPEKQRPQFEIAYWWAAMNDDAFREMQSHIPEGAMLWVFPHHDGLKLLREHGQFRTDIRLVQPVEKPQFTLLYGRMGSLADPKAAPMATVFLHQTPVWEQRIAGVRVAALYHSKPNK